MVIDTGHEIGVHCKQMVAIVKCCMVAQIAKEKKRYNNLDSHN